MKNYRPYGRKGSPCCLTTKLTSASFFIPLPNCSWSYFTIKSNLPGKEFSRDSKIDNKRQITRNSTVTFEPIQLKYAGKSNKCHPAVQMGAILRIIKTIGQIRRSPYHILPRFITSTHKY